MPVRAPRKRLVAMLALPILVASLMSMACGGSVATEETPGGEPATGGSSTTPASTMTDETASASMPDAAPSPSPTDPGTLGLFFPRQEQPLSEYPLTSTTGELMVDDAGCLRLMGGDSNGTTPIWPHDHALGTEAGEIYVLDGEGEVVARVGDVVDVGGGPLGTPFGGGLIVDREGGRIEGEPAKRELYERCPGSYWLVGLEVRTVRQ